MNLISEIDGFEYIRCPHCERIAGGITPAQKAAPDLLVMLKTAYKAIESLEHDALGVVDPDGTHNGYPIRDEILHEIAGVIRKARGET